MVFKHSLELFLSIKAVIGRRTKGFKMAFFFPAAKSIFRNI